MSIIIPKFNGKVVDNKLHFSNPSHFNHYLKKFEGKNVEIIVQKVKKIRSLASNNYYWKYLGLISEETGDDVNSLHEYLKRVLLPPKFISVLGKDIKVPASTTELSTNQMSDYLKSIEKLTGIPLLDTDKYYS